ncbi:MAG: PAS domain-containing protein [Brevundimonas sp.]|nr:PAS domain-containing protein [Brevundimonas sp.]
MASFERSHLSIAERSFRDFAEDDPVRAEGRAAEQIRSTNWSDTPLGPISRWDRELVAALNLILDARFPMFIAWGETLNLFYNDAYEPALLGKTVAQGQPMRTVFPEAWSSVGPLIEKAFGGEASYFEDFEVPLVRNAVLASTWWSFSYSPLRAEAGRTGGVLGVVYETTRRLLSDEALRSSEAALLTVTEMTPGLLWQCEADGRLTWVNQRLLDYFGLDHIGEAHWDDFVLPEDVEAARKVYRVCLDERRPFHCQQRLRDKDGRYRWFMVRCQQMFDSKGEIAGWCGSAIDIDEWRLATDGLSDQSDLLRDLNGAEATLLWVADVESHRVTLVNAQSNPLWGLPTDGEALSWDRWAESVHADDRAQFLAAFSRAAGGKTAQCKFRRLTGAGSARRFQLTAFPIVDGQGHLRRIGGMMVEIGRDMDPRAYLVDSDPVRASAFSQAFARKGFRIRTFTSPAELEHVADDLVTGCVIVGVDHDMEAVVKAAATLKQASHLRWLAVGDFSQRLEDVVRLMKLGAADVLSSPDAATVVEAGQAALALARPEPEKTSAPESARQRVELLSRREREVLDGLVAGGTNKTIAQKLQLSPRTVETHRAHLMDRLGASSLADLIKLAAEAGI